MIKHTDFVFFAVLENSPFGTFLEKPRCISGKRGFYILNPINFAKNDIRSQNLSRAAPAQRRLERKFGFRLLFPLLLVVGLSMSFSRTLFFDTKNVRRERYQKRVPYPAGSQIVIYHFKKYLSNKKNKKRPADVSQPPTGLLAERHNGVLIYRACSIVPISPASKATSNSLFRIFCVNSLISGTP